MYVWGEEVQGGGVHGGRGVVCASVCTHCPKVFPVATSATPAPFKPSSHRGSLPSVHTGILPPCCLSAPEKGVGTSQPSQEAGLRLTRVIPPPPPFSNL